MDLKALASQLLQLSPQERAAMLNAAAIGFDHHIGLSYREVDAERTVAEVAVERRHLQPYGFVHGGVYCAMVEAVGSVGAGFGLFARGFNVVGVENRTRFVRPAKEGVVLTATALPESQEGERHVWRVEVRGPDGTLHAEGSLVLAVLDADRPIGGERVRFDPDR